MTDIPLKAAVTCSDGPAGESSAVVIDPVKKNVTHVVVKIAEFDEHMVPLERVVRSDHDSITLDCTRQELAQMPLFKEVHYVQGIPYYPEFQGGLWESPYATLDYGLLASEEEMVPPGELAVRRGDAVTATDGYLGVVGEFIVDSESGHISHLVLQKGHLWGKREVTLPLELIDRVEAGEVFLTVDKEAVNRLPAVKVKRHYSGHTDM